MKKLCIVFLLSGLFFFLPASTALATAEQAYQDYLYQSDVYRQKYNDFSIAKNEYLKFKTLASEAAAITKTREMLSQRAQLLRAYLLLLNEKMNETPGMTQSDKELYRTLINNEVQFLENHSQFVTSIESLKDAVKASEQLESHYLILQTSMRQTILGISSGKLKALGDSYSERMVTAKALIDQVKGEIPLDKQTVLDRWFQQISNKRTLYLEKHDTIGKTITGMSSASSSQLDQKFLQTLKQISEAKQDLREGTSFLGELIFAMRYKD